MTLPAVPGLAALTLALAALSAPALAHEAGGLPHVHPHADWTALLGIALAVAAGGLALWRLQAARARTSRSKDRRHDPR